MLACSGQQVLHEQAAFAAWRLARATAMYHCHSSVQTAGSPMLLQLKGRALRVQDTNKVLAISRIMVAWQPVGICAGVFDMCARYVGEREQFGAPLGSFQLVQEQLARMLGNIQAMFLMCWRLSKLYEQVRSSPPMRHCMPCLCAHAMMTGLVRMPGDMELLSVT